MQRRLKTGRLDDCLESEIPWDFPLVGREGLVLAYYPSLDQLVDELIRSFGRGVAVLAVLDDELSRTLQHKGCWLWVHLEERFAGDRPQ